MSERARVLLCDDVALLREMLRYALEEGDDIVVVGEADNGIDGVRLTHELKPDLVVLDLAMPEMDGLEAIGYMRAVTPPPMILVHSGFDAASMQDKVLELGAQRYL